MSVYVVTGKLGAGKTLVAVGRIKDYLIEGRKVATNLDLNLHNLIGYKAKKTRVTRLPDIPTIDDLEALGQGYTGEYQGEHRNGLLVLDECGSFLNARDFNDSNRKGLRDWVIHARKKRWDVIFIIQHLEALDKQFRLMFAEHTVFCMRFDRVPIPFLTFFIKLCTGFRLTFPKMHRGLVKYGAGQQAITVDTWWYRGTTLYDAYDTEQAFAPDETQKNYSYLPPYYTHGVNHDSWSEFKRTIRRYTSRVHFKARQLFFIGLLGGFFVPSLAFNTDPEPQPVETQPPGQTSDEQSQVIENPEYFIVGKIEIDENVTFLFQDAEGNSAFPEYDGYKIRPIHPCKIALIKKRKAIYAKCPEPSDVDFMSASDGDRASRHPLDSDTSNQNDHAGTSPDVEQQPNPEGETPSPY